MTLAILSTLVVMLPSAEPSVLWLDQGAPAPRAGYLLTPDAGALCAESVTALEACRGRSALELASCRNDLGRCEASLVTTERERDRLGEVALRPVEKVRGEHLGRGAWIVAVVAFGLGVGAAIAVAHAGGT